MRTSDVSSFSHLISVRCSYVDDADKRTLRPRPKVGGGTAVSAPSMGYSSRPSADDMYVEPEGEEEECPLCFNPLDASERAFFPCTKCRYQA